MSRNSAVGQPWLTGATWPGCALPQLEAPPQLPRLRAADRLHRAPEVGGRGLVGDVADLAGQLAVGDLVEPLAGELEVEALHVDAPRPVADDVEPVLDLADQLLGAGAVLGGLQRDVGHPLDRDVPRGVGERAAVGAASVELGLHVAHRAVELVADQDAVPDDVPALGLHALVVVPDRGQAVLDGAVAGDVHDVGAVLQRVELVVGRERRAGVVGLVAERPVELGGVADRLVDGQPEVRRVDDQVVAAGLDGRRLELLGQQLGHLVELGVPVVEAGGEVLPPPADGEGDAPHRVEGVRAGAHRLDLRVDPDPLLGGHRAGQVGVVLVLLHLPDRGRRVVDRRALPQPLGPVDEQRRLLRDRHLERVHVVRRDPGDVGVHRLGGDLHRRAGHLRGHLGHRDRGLRDPPASSVVSTTPEANPHEPRWITRTAKPDVLGVAARSGARRRGPRGAGAGSARSGSPRGWPPAPVPGRGRRRRARGRGGR